MVLSVVGLVCAIGAFISNSKLEADKIIAEGEKEAARIYNESYSKDKEFYELYRTLQSYKTTLLENWSN